ncbi:MAG: hypothetical protein PUK70_11065 [Bacteroidales bacterium]|nr:hypothetical protein [Bacteroidales bacterium]MDY6001865.1 hypothetical protein [Candidatus Cryptobacteroides sp.]
MNDDVIQILVTVGILLLGILQPLISKLVKNAGLNVPDNMPEIPDEEFMSEEESGSGGNSVPAVNAPGSAMDVPGVPEQSKAESGARKLAKESSSNETRKKRQLLDKRKMIIYSEIMKPKFDDF